MILLLLLVVENVENLRIYPIISRLEGIFIGI